MAKKHSDRQVAAVDKSAAVHGSIEDAIEATRRHITIAKGLIAAGMKLMQKANASDGDSSASLNQASVALERGTKMEREAMDKLTELLKKQRVQ